jgi:uncharacterized membrane protein YbjE (DUF340 family)
MANPQIVDTLLLLSFLTEINSHGIGWYNLSFITLTRKMKPILSAEGMTLNLPY